MMRDPVWNVRGCLLCAENDEKLGDPLHGAYSASSPIEFSLLDLMWDLNYCLAASQ